MTPRRPTAADRAPTRPAWSAKPVAPNARRPRRPIKADLPTKPGRHRRNDRNRKAIGNDPAGDDRISVAGNPVPATAVLNRQRRRTNRNTTVRRSTAVLARAASGAPQARASAVDSDRSVRREWADGPGPAKMSARCAAGRSLVHRHLVRGLSCGGNTPVGWRAVTPGRRMISAPAVRVSAIRAAVGDLARSPRGRIAKPGGRNGMAPAWSAAVRAAPTSGLDPAAVVSDLSTTVGDLARLRWIEIASRPARNGTVPARNSPARAIAGNSMDRVVG